MSKTMDRINVLLACLLTASVTALPGSALNADVAKPNVLFIVIDDWNGWGGRLGNEQAKTPNIDRLAGEGMRFTGAYAAFCTSTNLKDWTHRSMLPDYIECPELFELPVAGDPANSRWVIFGADAQPLAGGKPVSLPVGTDLPDIRLDFEVGTARRIVLNLPGRSVAYDAMGRKVHRTPLEPVDGRVSLQVLADRSLTEISGNDGRVCISGGGPAKIGNPGPVSVTAHGGDAKLVSLEVHELKSIW